MKNDKKKPWMFKEAPVKLEASQIELDELKKYNGKIARVCNGKYFSVFMKINDKEWSRLIRNKRILYKRE